MGIGRLLLKQVAMLVLFRVKANESLSLTLLSTIFPCGEPIFETLTYQHSQAKSTISFVAKSLDLKTLGRSLSFGAHCMGARQQAETTGITSVLCSKTRCSFNHRVATPTFGSEKLDE